jgi:ubiquinol-cytochrome c reductase iron-sulfur subunit
MQNQEEQNKIPLQSEALENPERRDFVMAAACVAGAGAVMGAAPFIASLAPSEDVLAVGSTEVDLNNIKEGEVVTIMWRGQPTFIMHRTKAQIEAARSAKMSDLVDPQPDEERVKKEQWLITLGVCTHLGCVPLANKGDFGGWLCPCHGSHYDTSGRIRKGPAPANLAVPPYEFISETKIRIG